ncbi:uncharacterized protein LOC108032330 [Drosophila biarmipes]|uniref:uncharacterized protein LOC108032330 n=1 Tax=Drosophila biarmipes TaxID=125945 RepID=UPI0007E706C7|nr:uncharacterized protein LOC108032330 [Drosophila biarmipes]
MKTSYLICGIYVLMDLASSAERSFRIYFDEFAIKYKVADIFEKVECHLSQLNNRSYINAEMILKREVNDMTIRATMDFWKPNSQINMKVYDVRLDGCDLLRSINKNKLLNLYVKTFKKHASVTLSCPFKANYSYKMVDWFMEENDLPPYMPVGKFRTLTEYFTRQRLAIRVVAHGNVSANQ